MGLGVISVISCGTGKNQTSKNLGRSWWAHLDPNRSNKTKKRKNKSYDLPRKSAEIFHNADSTLNRSC